MNRELLTVLIVDGIDQGARLCRRHADRVTAPDGWAVTDVRSDPAPDPLAVDSPLLSRAFYGSEAPARSSAGMRPPRRLAWFEQAD